MSLGEIVTVSSGKNTERQTDGAYPVYGSTGLISRTNHPAYTGRSILVARVGANCGFCYTVAGEYDVSDNTLILRVKDSINCSYIYYLLYNERLNKYAKGGGQPLITASQLKNLQIPLPPLPEQERIVAILDRFDALVNDLSSGLPAELNARRQQYEYYRDKLLTFKPAV
ncbi:MAG: restriction endonuclease subunit S [Victivallales bacterium]|nr:restriction endonuclease subunit S [Victivallales bacterium]